MVIGLNPEKERAYVLQCDRENPQEEQTVFYYRALPYGSHCDVQDGVIELQNRTDAGTTTAIRSGTQERKVLLATLTRVERYHDEDGTPLQWPQGRGKQVEDERMRFLTTMQPVWRRELAEAILDGTKPTEKDEAELRFRGADGAGVPRLPDAGGTLPAEV